MWPGRQDARRDYVAIDQGVQINRIYLVEIASSPAWFQLETYAVMRHDKLNS
jgi:hypothetical protein